MIAQGVHPAGPYHSANTANRAFFLEDRRTCQAKGEGGRNQPHGVGKHEQKTPQHERYGQSLSGGAVGALKGPYTNTKKYQQGGYSQNTVFRKHAGELGMGGHMFTVMATQGGAQAMLLEGAIGSIAAGKRADLVLYDLSAPWWTPLNDPVQQLVYGENGGSVDTVIVDGRVVVDGRRITTFDADAVLAEARPMLATIRARNSDLHRVARRMAAIVS